MNVHRCFTVPILLQKRKNKIDIIKRLCATIFLRIMRAPTSALLQCTKGRSDSLRPRLAGKSPHKRFKEIPRLLPSERYPFQRRSPCRESTGLRNTRSLGKRRKEGRKEGRKAVLTGFGKGKPSSEKAPFPSVTPPLSRPVHENQLVCPSSGSASNSNNWPSVFLPNATFALLMMRQGTLMILYRSRSSGKWFTS